MVSLTNFININVSLFVTLACVYSRVIIIKLWTYVGMLSREQRRIKGTLHPEGVRGSGTESDN